MSSEPISVIQPAIEEVYSKPNDDWCATFEIPNSAYWVQVVKGTLNFAYPRTEEPSEHLAEFIASLPGTELIEWKSGTFVTYAHDDCPSRDISEAVNLLFRWLLSNAADTYELDVTVHQL